MIYWVLMYPRDFVDLDPFIFGWITLIEKALKGVQQQYTKQWMCNGPHLSQSVCHPVRCAFHWWPQTASPPVLWWQNRHTRPSRKPEREVNTQKPWSVAAGVVRNTYLFIITGIVYRQLSVREVEEVFRSFSEVKVIPHTVKILHKNEFTHAVKTLLQ